ncbi:hypothetical protein [Oscillatoria acuminata]|uniref:Uncharacterized protein n=1 Tax=Oscillatoria acuminata PCC 6304 TaxID=56110 RepID=K9TDE1_9CYAN|nr:hypothetical protein [Oscillatoria acuminata]AFY80555.1 hypothetical protein Oscil6304_0820 [Oscillatoria acuminata PCC 6304]
MKMLLLFIGEDEKFNLSQVADSLTKIPNIQNFKQGDFVGSILECEFSEKTDFTIIRLSDDLETISIDGDGEASLKIALEIQKHYPQNLRLIDSNYSFDIELAEIKSVGQLRHQMRESASFQLPV